MPKIDVCMSPDLLPLYSLEGRIVVVTDILRATSCMVSGFAAGIASIVPYADLEHCRAQKEKGFFIAGERNGEKVEGFDLGNSPFDYMEAGLVGKNVAVTTTNGTRALDLSKTAEQVVVGAFLNLQSVVSHLENHTNDVLVVCAGWKGKVNLEDSLFAGALVYRLSTHERECDAPLMVERLYLDARKDMFTYLSASSHVNRLKRLGIEKDIEFCLEEDKYEVLPVLVGDQLIDLLAHG